MVDDCQAMMDIQKAAKQNPTGALRISQCHEICAPESVTCPVSMQDPAFIVMDMAGKNGFKWEKTVTKDKDAVARVLSQVAQGVGYLAETLSPPRIHHDLKWGNICVKNVSGKWEGILIDIGSMLEAPQDEEKGGSSYTP